MWRKAGDGERRATKETMDAALTEDRQCEVFMRAIEQL